MAAALPAEWYFEAARYERERSSIFANEWLWFAAASEVESSGAYVARVYAGWPLMVMRGSDGVLRGFHNVCRHRAGPLVDDGVGTCAQPRLPIPRLGVLRPTGGSDRRVTSARSWIPMSTRCTRFTLPSGAARCSSISSAAPRPLADDLAEFFAEMCDFPIEAMTLVSSRQHELACNWKTYADNYLEGYHIPLMHPELNRQFDAKRYRVELGDRYCRHHAPRRDGGASEGRWLFRWPNLAMNIYGTAMNIEVIVPTGPESCTVLYNHFFLDPHAADVDEVIAFSDVVMEQDRRMVEIVQRNLAGGSYGGGVLSPRHENGVRQFQDLVRNADRNAE